MARRRFAPFLLALVVALGLLPVSPASAARNTPPRIKRAVLKDSKDAGHLANRVILTYNERINHRVDRDGRYPFKIQGYKIRKINAARRSFKLVIIVKPTAKAKERPDFIQYTRTRRQPVRDLKKLQARKQFMTKNIIGVPIPPPPPPPARHTLTVTRSGDGSVTSTPAGIDCGATCQAQFDNGATVELTATPGAQSAPEVAWSGCASSTATTCMVTMDAAKSVGVTFHAAGTRSLTLSREGNGTVTSTSTPPQETQINCSTTCATTEARYPDNSVVTLTATPGQQGMLITWGGHCGGTGQTCSLTMTESKSVTVKFELPRMTVTRAGTGVGTVTSSPAGIDCGSDCTHDFAKDQEVTLTATPADGSEFKGWSGGATCATSLTCKVTMNSAKDVTATFDEITGPVNHQLSVASEGSGTVTCSTNAGPVGCNATYAPGTQITITAIAVAPSTTAQLSGACSSAALPVATCTVTMDAPKTVTATFTSPVSTGDGTTTDGTDGGGIITLPPLL